MNARLTCCALATLLLSPDVVATEPVRSRDWDPVLASDIALPVIPQPFWAAHDSASDPGSDAGATQWVQIDPSTGKVVPGRIPAALRPALLDEPLRPMRLRLNSAGYLYLDTRGYQSVVTLHLAPDGSMHTNCTEVAHRHGHDASHAAPPTSPTEDRP